MTNQLIYTGKAKDIYTTEDEHVIKSVYKDQATMLNGARKETIKGKGVLNNQISSLIFEKLNAAGVATHFIERISDTEQLNKKVKIIPLEVVLRNVTAGSFSKRFGVEEGLDLKTPIVEFYYKNDDLDDPFINDEHVKFLDIANDEQIDYIVNHEISLEDSHPRGEKPKYFGEIIEQDGSIHEWFGVFKTCLHLAIDKATSTIVGAYFDKQETLNGYYHVFHQILINYGIPYKFLTDNRTVFNYMSLNPDKRTSDKDVLTQYGYACKQLGVELETTSVSQAKGLIERTNGTFQGRLVSELRLNNITTIDEANKYLIDVFVPYFNNRFALDYKKFESVFEQSPNEEIINYTLAVLTPRKIDNGNSIKYQNKYYQPYLNNQLKCFIPKTDCLVIKAFNGDLLVTIDEQILELKELSRNERFSKEFDEVIEVKEKKKYIPPMTHPWKLSSFLKQIEKSHNQHQYA